MIITSHAGFLKSAGNDVQFSYERYFFEDFTNYLFAFRGYPAPRFRRRPGDKR